MGAGINLFKQLFPESYYAYQTASLESSKPVSKKIYDSDNNVIAEYPLGSDEIRGVFKIENGELVAYGDIHNSDGTGTLYFGIVDLGTLDYTKLAVSDYYVFHTTISDKALTTNGICASYVNSHNGRDSLNDMEFGTYNLSGGLNIVCFRNDSLSSGDATAFKTAMSGVYLIYELATPTPTTYTAFSNPMISGSTEEFTDTRSVKMFVGHDSLYYSSPFKGW